MHAAAPVALALLAAAALPTAAAAVAAPHRRSNGGSMEIDWNHLPRDWLHPDIVQQEEAAAAFPAPRYFTQDVDHFDGSNGDTWQQAYYVNDTFWQPGSDAPVFVCVGGEGPPLDGSVVVASVHCNVAVEWLQETKALMVALEHRGYPRGGGGTGPACCMATHATGTMQRSSPR